MELSWSGPFFFTGSCSESASACLSAASELSPFAASSCNFSDDDESTILTHHCGWLLITVLVDCCLFSCLTQTQRHNNSTGNSRNRRSSHTTGKQWYVQSILLFYFSMLSLSLHRTRLTDIETTLSYSILLSIYRIHGHPGPHTSSLLPNGAKVWAQGELSMPTLIRELITPKTNGTFFLMRITAVDPVCHLYLI